MDIGELEVELFELLRNLRGTVSEYNSDGFNLNVALCTVDEKWVSPNYSGDFFPIKINSSLKAEQERSLWYSTWRFGDSFYLCANIQIQVDLTLEGDKNTEGCDDIDRVWVNTMHVLKENLNHPCWEDTTDWKNRGWGRNRTTRKTFNVYCVDTSTKYQYPFKKSLVTSMVKNAIKPIEDKFNVNITIRRQYASLLFCRVEIWGTGPISRNRKQYEAERTRAMRQIGEKLNAETRFVGGQCIFTIREPFGFIDSA